MKLSGYRVSHKNRWLLLKNGILNSQEFLLFEYYLDLMDFDQSHENFGRFEAFLNEVAIYFGKQEETVREWHNGLLGKGFIQVADKRRGLFSIKSPARYSNAFGGKASQFATDEKTTPTIDFILQNICFSPEKVKTNPPKDDVLDSNNTAKALGSYKDEYKVISPSNKKVVVIRQKEIRTNEEYEKIHKDNGYSALSPDDLKLIDQITTEEIVIETPEQEQQVVQTYFKGNWDEYQKSLIN